MVSPSELVLAADNSAAAERRLMPPRIPGKGNTDRMDSAMSQ